VKSTRTRLGEIFKFQNGRGFKKSEWENTGLPIIRITNLNNQNAAFNYYSGPYDKAIEVNAGDLLFSWSGTVGSSFGAHLWDGEKGLLNQHIFKVEHKNNISKRYAYYALQWITGQVEKQVNGAVGLVHITKAKLNEFEIPLPDVTEQQHIVAILDDAFERIDTAIANTEKNLANARELRERFWDKVFTHNNKGWAEKKLGEIADFKNGLNFTKSSRGELVDIVGVKDFQSNIFIPVEQLDSVQVEGLLDEAYELKAKDILTVRSNGNKQLIGRCMLASNIKKKTSYSGFTIRIRVASDQIDPEYLVRYLKSERIHSMLINSGSGANINNLNQGTLSSLPVVHPGKDEQARLVSRINEFEEYSSELINNLNTKKSSMVELKQALLQKAFSGELTVGMHQETLAN